MIQLANKYSSFSSSPSVQCESAVCHTCDDDDDDDDDGDDD